MGNLLQVIQRAATGQAKQLNSVHDRGWHTIFEARPGNWQRNIEVSAETTLAHHAVFACVSLIASDIAKLRPKLVQLQDGIWTEIENTAHSPLLHKPNRFSTRVQFFESWLLSRLTRGNTYALKARDARGVVTEMFVLDPNRVRPLVSDDGAVFYELDRDNLSGITEPMIVPEREVFHDRANCLFHPLVGISPIYASGLAAAQGLRIQRNSAKFFENGSRPGGILTAPGRIDQENAERIKEYWDRGFSGDNSDKVAVLGDDLKYQALGITAQESQLIEQLKWTAETVCSTFHVPPYMIGAGPVPALGNVEALQTSYYGQALQGPIEAIEACLDDGLNMPRTMGVEFDLTGLLRMDTASQFKALGDAVGSTIMTPNEARKVIDLPPKEGGDELYAQQQDFSLAALAERDRSKPFSQPREPHRP